MNFLRRLGFNLWYFRHPPWDSGISPPELIDFINSNPPGRALDIGCGTGTNVVTLSKSGWQVTGFDFAPHAIQLARRKIQKADVRADLFIDDATQMDKVGGQYDLALDLGCFHGIDAKKDYLHQLGRILSPNGFWLMYGFFKSRGDQTGPGLVSSDLDLIQSHSLTLVSRRDGVDKRERPSAWFLYQKSAIT